MFKMTKTMLAAPDGMNIKVFLKGQEYPKSALSDEIYNAYKQRGDLIEIEQNIDPKVEIETEKNVLPTVEDLHKVKKGAKR